jgi:phosphoribosylformylglycinamidine synthase
MHGLGWVRSCHDVSQGGLLTALAEMALGGRGEGGLGFTLDLAKFDHVNLPFEKILFSETGAYVVEVPPGLERDVIALCARTGADVFKLGELVANLSLEIVRGTKRFAAWDLSELRGAFLSGCRAIFGVAEKSKGA